MRGLFTRRIPEIRRVLLVESGGRHILDKLLPHIYSLQQPLERVDVVTCYGTPPASFDGTRGETLQVTANRGAFIRGRVRAGYDVVGIICSGEPIMTRWKWALAARVPAKLFIINENGDYFWFDRGNWRIIRHFIAVRSGLSGAELAPALGRMLLFPFTLLYLIVWFIAAHVRRRVHI